MTKLWRRLPGRKYETVQTTAANVSKTCESRPQAKLSLCSVCVCVRRFPQEPHCSTNLRRIIRF